MSHIKEERPRRDERRLGRTEAELADYWGISTRTLQRWRRAGQGPQFLRIGRRVIYPFAETETFEQAMRAPQGGAR